MEIKFNHFDNQILKNLDDQSKLGYFIAFLPSALYDGLRTMCKKHHIKLQEDTVDKIMEVISERLKPLTNDPTAKE